jgi:hypothetical protein
VPLILVSAFHEARLIEPAETDYFLKRSWHAEELEIATPQKTVDSRKSMSLSFCEGFSTAGFHLLATMGLVAQPISSCAGSWGTRFVGAEEWTRGTKHQRIIKG